MFEDNGNERESLPIPETYNYTYGIAVLRRHPEYKLTDKYPIKISLKLCHSNAICTHLLAPAVYCILDIHDNKTNYINYLSTPVVNHKIQRVN